MGIDAAFQAQVTPERIEATAHSMQLSVFGAFHPGPEDAAPDGTRTIVMLGPREPGFWRAFTASPEYQDSQSDPLDRWSTRVVTQLADDLGATALFPFGGPPYQPFIRWAQATARAHLSPVGLLVHDRAGLMVSYRGALGFAEALDLPPTQPASPCLTCETQPCQTACPVDAFAGEGYDVQACKTDLDRPGNDCMARGCAVRRACPVSQSYGRTEAQSAFHMEAFK